MDEVSRRGALKLIAAVGASAAVGCTDRSRKPEEKTMTRSPNLAPDAVVSVSPLSYPWRTSDPFLTCMHHDDGYPKGNEQLGPAASLAGRELGQDFGRKDGWSMYHGEVVPGFPQHPHRGFETLTVVRRGMLDHSDSMGATARYGQGDVQWLSAGRGINHSEMFPLLNREGANRLELFQIWLNLPSADKSAQPVFSMLWKHTIPVHVARDTEGRTTEVTIIAGRLGELKGPPPPPNSWASRPDTEVAVWTVKMAPGARWTLPAASAGIMRALYYFQGSGLSIGGRALAVQQRIDLRSEAEVVLENGPQESELLMLQGRPIREPVVQYGPFVMNTREEIQQTFTEFQSTRFGGWPWQRPDPVHPREEGRFARFTDGRIERPT